jgi:hypothetical protein
MIRLTPLLLMFALAGCNSQSAPPTTQAQHEEHAHEAGGPHGGAIVELGDYHAEVVHDDTAGTVTVYILDGAATANVPVDATEATINVTHDGQGEQFKLAASPLEGEPVGRSSRFVSSDADLSEDLDLEGTSAVFVITIDGQQSRGNIAHDHDHEHAADDDHDHDHDHE